MHRYKWIYRFIQAFVILVSLSLLLVILLPILLFSQRNASMLKLGYIGEKGVPVNGSIELSREKEKAGAEDGVAWLRKYWKMEQVAAGDADLLVFRDATAVTDENTNKIQGKAVFFERLFSQDTGAYGLQNRLEYLVGASYTGFWGKTYKDLGDTTAIPAELASRYAQEYQTEWAFQGEGMILSGNDHILVLVKGKDYQDRMRLKTDTGIDIPYYGFFEIIGRSSTGKAVAHFALNLTGSGKKQFAANHLPESFPAICHIENSLYEAFYVAGDFSGLKLAEPYANEAMPWFLRNKGIYEKFTNEEAYWKVYFPLADALATKLESRKEKEQPLVAMKKPQRNASFLADAENLYLSSENGKKPFFVKGVNLGAALPGKTFTEFPLDKSIYLNWMAQMSEMNINTIRVYTLLPPVFYQALLEFNLNSKAPLYLLQEIWPEEHPTGNDYLSTEYNKIYSQEIRYAVHAIHGNIVIPQRSYRAYGMYAYDVSPYLLGYLVGREMDPDEVAATDKLHIGYLYKGAYIYSEPTASPTESWLAASCDNALMLEDQVYGNRPLAAIVSWPTLDPLSHDSEWNTAGDKSLQFNDREVVNIGNIGINRDKTAGFFGAYHIYPNYPDFMNNDAAYNEYHDDQGRFRYGGYLKAFMAQHRNYPAVVAEYGLSTSLVTAHSNPDGLNHGGLSETEQAQGIIRMTKAIAAEGYAGAVLFEWMDEWAKKTWSTEKYMIPYNRHALWHNVLDPEQNYGLLANRSVALEMKTVYEKTVEEDALRQASVGQDASFLDICLTFQDDMVLDKPLTLAVSTYGGKEEAKTRWEFLLEVVPTPKLLVNPGYNWVTGHYASVDAAFDVFEEMIFLTNAENVTKEGVLTPAKYANMSLLKGLVMIDKLSDPGRVKISIRLPYGLLGFSDPSSQKVLHDPKSFIPDAIDQINVETTGEIKFMLLLGKEEIHQFSYQPVSWEEPLYQEQRKEGFDMLRDYLGGSRQASN